MGRIEERVLYWIVLLPMGRIDEVYHNGVLPLMGRIDDRVSYWSVLLDMGRIDDRVSYWSVLLDMGRIDDSIILERASRYGQD